MEAKLPKDKFKKTSKSFRKEKFYNSYEVRVLGSDIESLFILLLMLLLYKVLSLLEGKTSIYSRISS